MKLYLCRRKNSKVKIILMSATLNSELFSKFFAKNPLGQFIQAKIVSQKMEKHERRIRMNRENLRSFNHEEEDDREPGLKFLTNLEITENYTPAARVELPNGRKFSIEIKYLDEFEKIKDYRSWN